MEINTIVVLSLHDPKERVWGQLVALTEAGVTVRGIDLGAFDDFLRQVKSPEEGVVGLATIFYPMRRVERIALDEAQGGLPSLSQTFERVVGRSVLEYLAALSEV